jgi:hypothetical protein
MPPSRTSRSWADGWREKRRQSHPGCGRARNEITHESRTHPWEWEAIKPRERAANPPFTARHPERLRRGFPGGPRRQAGRRALQRHDRPSRAYALLLCARYWYQGRGMSAGHCGYRPASSRADHRLRDAILVRANSVLLGPASPTTAAERESRWTVREAHDEYPVRSRTGQR